MLIRYVLSQEQVHGHLFALVRDEIREMTFDADGNVDHLCT